MPKVSIIIPIYNVQQYLEECLDSVMLQTLRDIEIICINDGSTDNSLSILNACAQGDSRFVVIDKENSGYGASMNLGIEISTGEYIGIVEPDDFVSLNMFEVLYKKAVDYDLDFIKADFYRFKKNSFGDMEMVYNRLSKNEKDYNVVFNPSRTPRAIRFKMNTWSGIYRRNFINQYNIRHNESPGASFQDNGFWFQTFIYARRAMIVDRPFYLNRRDNPNSSVNDPKKVFCINDEYAFIRKILQRDKEIWERFKGVYWYKKYDNYIHRLDVIADEYKQPFMKRFSGEFNEAIKANEIDSRVFKAHEWKDIEQITSDSELFLDNHKNVYREQNGTNREAQLEKELMDIRHSFSYRLGRMLTILPRKIRERIKKL